MSLPGLKSSIELESAPSGFQLIDRTSGQTLPISPTESQLLNLWDGVQTATALSARLFVEVVAVSAPAKRHSPGSGCYSRVEHS